MKPPLNILCIMGAILPAICFLSHAQPNSVTTTKFVTAGSGNMVQKTYSNGLGQILQTKLQLSTAKDLVTCSFTDDLGRMKYTTLPFVDKVSAGVFLPGAISDNEQIDNAVEQQSGRCRSIARHAVPSVFVRGNGERETLCAHRFVIICRLLRYAA